VLAADVVAVPICVPPLRFDVVVWVVLWYWTLLPLFVVPFWHVIVLPLASGPPLAVQAPSATSTQFVSVVRQLTLPTPLWNDEVQLPPKSCHPLSETGSTHVVLVKLFPPTGLAGVQEATIVGPVVTVLQAVTLTHGDEAPLPTTQVPTATPAVTGAVLVQVTLLDATQVPFCTGTEEVEDEQVVVMKFGDEAAG
jgi:hypothetical protein